MYLLRKFVPSSKQIVCCKYFVKSCVNKIVTKLNRLDRVTLNGCYNKMGL